MPTSEPRFYFANNRLTFYRKGRWAQVSGWPELDTQLWLPDGRALAGGVPDLPAGRLLQHDEGNRTAPNQLLFPWGEQQPMPTAPAVCPNTRRLHREAAAWDAFARTIPAPVRQTVAPFRHGQIGLLQVLAGRQARAFRELLAANPALAMALAHAHRFVPGLTAGARLSWIETLIPRRRAEIATALGFPPATVRSLGRIRPAHCQPALLVRLRRVLRCDPLAVRALSHLPQIPGHVLSLLVTAPDLWTPALLENMIRIPGAVRREVLRELRRLQQFRRLGLLEEIGLRSRILRPDTVAVWSRLCMRQVEVRDWQRHAEAIAAIAPPVPGNATIRPLTRLDDFLQEHREMQHCLLTPTYLRRLLTRQSYYYRTLPPLERATVEIGRTDMAGEPPSYELREAGGPAHHRGLSQETLSAIQDWIAPHGRPRRNPADPTPDLFAIIAAAQAPLEGAPSLADHILGSALPRPPVPGTPNIDPLAFPHEFIAEATETQTRAHLLLPLVGPFYVYRVLGSAGGDRATVVVESHRTQCCTNAVSLVALWGHRGAAVTEKTRNMVTVWTRTAESDPDWSDYGDYGDDGPDDDPF